MRCPLIKNKKNTYELHKSLKETMEHEKDSLARMSVYDDRLNAMERRSRKWGIIVFGVGETKGEYIEKILANDMFLNHNLGG